MSRNLLTAACAAALLALSSTSCVAQEKAALPFQSTPVAQFKEPWAMTFLPDGRLLVSEKKGALKLVAPGGTPAE
ncbi:MAG: PQQ-dependent sugar dehydrogenase, partial [Pseudoxanthomonas sp.]